MHGRNVLPHDMGRRQPPKLDTRLKQANEIAEKIGFNPFVLGRMYHREEMISKTRKQIGRCRFDATKCAQGLNCLTDFDASKRKTNSNSKMMTDVADSFMYMAMDAVTKKDRELLQPNFDRKLFSVIEEYDATFCSFFWNIPLDECYFEENRLGFVDSIYRQFKMTLKVAANVWDKNSKLKAKAEKFPDEKVTILHVVTYQQFSGHFV